VPLAPIPAVPHHRVDPHHPPPHFKEPKSLPIPTFKPAPKPNHPLPHHGPHIEHNLHAPDTHHSQVHPKPALLHKGTLKPKLDALKASIVQKFNSQLQRSKRESRSEPDAKAFPRPKPIPLAEAIAIAEADAEAEAEAEAEADAEADAAAEAAAEAEADPEAQADADAEAQNLRFGNFGPPPPKLRRTTIDDLSIDELQSLLHSVNNGKLLRDERPPPTPLGSHVLDLSRLSGGLGGSFEKHQDFTNTASLGGVLRNQQVRGSLSRVNGMDGDFISKANRPLSNSNVLGGDFLDDPGLKERFRILDSENKHSTESNSDRLSSIDFTVMGNIPSSSSSFSTLQGSQASTFMDDHMMMSNFGQDASQSQTFRSSTNSQASLGNNANLFSQSNEERRQAKQSSIISDDDLLAIMSNPRISSQLDQVTSMSDLVDIINKEKENNFVGGSNSGFQSDRLLIDSTLQERINLGRRQTEPLTLGGKLDTNTLSDDIVAKVIEHLKNNKPEFQLKSTGLRQENNNPPLPSIGAPFSQTSFGGSFGGSLVSPFDTSIANDHFLLPKNPLPSHHDDKHLILTPQPHQHHGSHHKLHPLPPLHHDTHHFVTPLPHLEPHHGSHHKLISDILHHTPSHHAHHEFPVEHHREHHDIGHITPHEPPHHERHPVSIYDAPHKHIQKEPHRLPHQKSNHDPHYKPHHKAHHDPHHDSHHDPHHDPHHEPHHEPHYKPKPVVTKKEVPAPYGCKAYSTKTCQKVPIVVPEKVPVPRCYDVPKVECFHVLAPVPDLECAPIAKEECMDIVKEVPYLAPEEKCYDIPREECVDITEKVPVVVCTQVDQNREPKATLISAPYGRLTSNRN